MKYEELVRVGFGKSGPMIFVRRKSCPVNQRSESPISQTPEPLNSLVQAAAKENAQLNCQRTVIYFKPREQNLHLKVEYTHQSCLIIRPYPARQRSPLHLPHYDTLQSLSTVAFSMAKWKSHYGPTAILFMPMDWI